MSSEKLARDWHNDFDIDDPAYGDLYNEVCDELVARCPVAHSKDGYYVVSRYQDTLKVLQDWETFSSADGIIGAVRAPGQPLFKPNETDPPEHTQLRRALNQFFAPKAIRKNEAGIRKIADGLIDAFIESGSVDIVSQYADPLPPIAFCQVVANMPAEDMGFLQKVFTDAITGPLESRGVNWVKGQEYLSDYMTKRRDEGRTEALDVIDAVLQFEFPDGRPYTHTDRAGSMAQIVAAGATTTGAVISGAIYHLATNPADRRRIQDDPSLLPTAVEEFLRVFVSAPNNGRRVMKDVDLAGTQLRGPHDGEKGDYIIYNLGGANRDPEVFDRPDELDITRKPNRHLSFAGGVHQCIGLHLARVNIRIAIEAFLERVPEFSVAPDYTPHFHGGITRAITELPVVFSA
jgi:cytochrome P450